MGVIGVGYSTDHDPQTAGRTAVEKAIANLGERPSLIIAFTSLGYNLPSLIQGIKSVSKGIPIIGASMGGILHREGYCVGNGVCIGAVKARDVYCFYREGLTKGDDIGRRIGEELWTKVKDRRGNPLLFCFFDGDSPNCPTTILRDIYRTIDTACNYFGGGAGSNLGRINSYQFINERILKDSCVGALCFFEKRYSIGIAHGFKPLSLPLLITKAKENIILELEWQDPVRVYREILGSEKPLSTLGLKYPFGIMRMRGDYLIRDPLKEMDGSIQLFGDIEENTVVQVMKGTKKDMLNAERSAIEKALSGINENVDSGIILSCISRYLLLRKGYNEEVDIIKGYLGDAPFLGCMSFGEIGILDCGMPMFHNKTFTCLLFEK